MMNLKTLIAAGAALTTLGFTPALAQDNYKDEYRVSTVVPAPFPWGLAAERWAELTAERTDGRIKMKIYPGVQLVQGDQTREFTALRQGVIDMAVGIDAGMNPARRPRTDALVNLVRVEKTAGIHEDQAVSGIHDEGIRKGRHEAQPRLHLLEFDEHAAGVNVAIAQVSRPGSLRQGRNFVHGSHPYVRNPVNPRG